MKKIAGIAPVKVVVCGNLIRWVISYHYNDLTNGVKAISQSPWIMWN